MKFLVVLCVVLAAAAATPLPEPGYLGAGLVAPAIAPAIAAPVLAPRVVGIGGVLAAPQPLAVAAAVPHAKIILG
ncbi:neuropeptide-like 3 [Schistocerca serialis cubense]|uniref:neuropeptide-like 3 n=1 Tax=Schistocerca nitens TaxID=7011 RepID=UPI002117BDA3|nr:neuropeptide-like 3 [Schistocerca nitens]XP_049963236.1 neuropeptide-like 3 [Schistocerca serialis cubense]